VAALASILVEGGPQFGVGLIMLSAGLFLNYLCFATVTVTWTNSYLNNFRPGIGRELSEN